jgi:hypothetical protein
MARRATTPTQSKPVPVPRAVLELGVAMAVADRWQLGIAERAHLIGVPQGTLYRWLNDGTPSALPAHVRERIGHVVAIDLAAQAFYGPGTALAADAVRRQGTAPNDRDPALPLCLQSTFALTEVRRAFEHRAGGSVASTMMPSLLPSV